MWPFRAEVADADRRAWVEDQFLWIADTWGLSALKARRLIRPIRQDFTATRGEDHGTALAVMKDLRRHLGLMHIDLVLEPQPVIPEGLHRGYGTLSDVAGTYWHDDDQPLITYDPMLLRRPVSYIATMAHELMHLKLAPHVAVMPGGAEAHELATDLHVIAEGFGTFQMEAAVYDGWSGYLSQPTRAYALALFLHLTDTPAAQALAHLSQRPTKLLKSALALIDRDGLPDGLT
jgi:hypothetical protein